MKIFRLPVFAAVFLLGFAAFFPARASLPPDSPPAQFVQKLGDKALTSLTARDLPSAERARRVRALLHEDFDIPTIGRFALGTYWSGTTEEQKHKYFALFEDMLVKTYTGRFSDYSGQSFKVISVSAPEKGGRDTLVDSQIVQTAGGAPVNVQWRVRGGRGSFRIVDVLVEGISMSVTQRSDFDAVIQQGGGKVEALLTSLQNHRG